MKQQATRLTCPRAITLGSLLGMLWLAGCSTPPPKTLPPAPVAVTPPPAIEAAPAQPRRQSQARTARDYRLDAARHLYALQPEKVYKGRLPPMLHAVAVLDVDIDRSGQVKALHWTRQPRHAPEVVAEIEKMVRDAAPYPAPQHLARVTYTDVWLWHKSGRFQLDTLTEGQD